MQLYQYQNFGANSSSGSYGARLNGAPRLVPVGPNGGGYIQSESAGYSLIDVINKFQWTTTPQLGRQEVPAIYLKEKRLVTNALVAQSIYYGLALTGTAAGGVAGFNALPRNLQQAALAFTGAFAGKQIGNAVGSIANSLGNAAGSFFKNPSIGTAISNLGGFAAPSFGIAGFNFGLTADTDLPSRALAFADDTLQNLRNYIPQRFNIESLGSDTLRPYEGLYITEDTRFIYNIPYFSNRQNFVSNSFDTSDEAFTQINPTQTQYLTEAVRDLAMGSSVLFNMDAPGIYVEKPKFYQFGSAGEDVSFSFPLINTGWSTFEDVVQNWQLLYLLTYQNRPNRRSRDLIDPPAIYEINIPGIKYSPFAYIEQMEVNFAGARRRMNIPVPYGSGITTINTIIPDAYVVTIRMKTLVGETQNFLYSMLSDKQNIVTVSNRTNPTDYASTLLNDAYNQTKQISQTQSQPFAQGLSEAFSKMMGGGNIQGGGIQ